jgi:hypothetical protein
MSEKFASWIPRGLAGLSANVPGLFLPNHSSPRTTKAYDRRNDETLLEEYERVGI